MTDDKASSSGARGDAAQSLFVVMAGGVLMIGVALIANAFLQTRALESLGLTVGNALTGVVATLPLALALFGFLHTSWDPLARFRESQIEFFSEIGFAFTWPRIIAIGLLAGVSEELLFRGVLQTLAERHMPLIAALIATNIFFGLLHARTALYAIIAGVVGAYLGLIFAATGSLTAPIITHALYDVIALYATRKAIDARAASED